MKKGFLLVLFVVFILACSGNNDRKNETTTSGDLPDAMVEELEKIESASEKVNDAADDLAADVDSLLNNL